MAETFKKKPLGSMAGYRRPNIASYTDENGDEVWVNQNQMRMDYHQGIFHGLKFGDGDSMTIPLVHNDVWPVEGFGTIVVTGNAPPGMEYIRCGGFTVLGTGALKTEIFSISAVPFDSDPNTILDTWPRSQNRTFWEDPNDATGASGDWYYNVNLETFVQPVNEGNTLQIYSPDKLNNYVFDCTLTSIDNDDDAIGVVAAADIIEGNLTFLTFWVHPGGLDGGNHRWSARFGDETNGATGHGSGMGEIIQSLNPIDSYANPLGNGWSGKTIRVRISREGDTITALCSDWNGTTLLPESEIVISANDLPRKGANLLSNPSSIGFATNSQADSAYTNYRVVSPDIGTYLDQYVQVFEDAPTLPEGQVGHLMTFKYYNEEVLFDTYEEYEAMQELNTFLHGQWS